MAKKGSPKTGTPSVETKLMQKEILALRRQKISFPDIAEKLGFTQGYVYKLYKKSLNAIIHESVEETRKMELENLDHLQTKVMEVINTIHPFISSGQVVRDIIDGPDGKPITDEEGNRLTVRLRDLTPVLQGIDRAVRIMERRARLLGLDAPTKTALTNPSGDKEASLVQFYLPSNGREDVTDSE